jgi:cell division septum initiation protein DivIVA
VDIILAGSTTTLLLVLAGLMLLALLIDVCVKRRRLANKQIELQQTINELQTKVMAFERSLHAIGQRLLVDEKVIRQLKDAPQQRPSMINEPIVKLSDEFPGQIAAWYEHEAERPDSMTEAESLLQAMLKQRKTYARA